MSSRTDQSDHFQNIQKDYDRIADEYDIRWKTYLQSIHAFIIDDLLRNKQPTSLLDVACGTGRVLRQIKRNCPYINITAIDGIPAMLKIAKKTVPEAQFVQKDVEKPWTELEDTQFDCVLSLSVLHHLNDHKLHLAKLHKHCRKNGTVYLADFCLDRTTMRIADLWWRCFQPSYTQSYRSSDMEEFIKQTGHFEIQEREIREPTWFWKVQIYKLKPM
mgnify:CR=1 FL=1